MKSIHIRDVDPEVIRKLARLAELHHRSMQGELRAILADAAKLLPEDGISTDLDLVTVAAGGKQAWDRDGIYAAER